MKIEEDAVTIVCNQIILKNHRFSIKSGLRLKILVMHNNFTY